MADSASVSAADAKVLYDSARKELIAALSKKRAVDKNLAHLEGQLYAFEGSYLGDTANSGGNIIHGFESYLKNPGSTKKKHDITDADRLFSNSSTTYLRSLDISPPSPPHLDYQNSNGLTTVSLPSQQEIQLTERQRRDRDRKRRKASHKAGTTSGDDTEPPRGPGRPNKRARLMTEE